MRYCPFSRDHSTPLLLPVQRAVREQVARSMQHGLYFSEIRSQLEDDLAQIMHKRRRLTQEDWVEALSNDPSVQTGIKNMMTKRRGKLSTKFRPYIETTAKTHISQCTEDWTLSPNGSKYLATLLKKFDLRTCIPLAAWVVAEVRFFSKKKCSEIARAELWFVRLHGFMVLCF